MKSVKLLAGAAWLSALFASTWVNATTVTIPIAKGISTEVTTSPVVQVGNNLVTTITSVQTTNSDLMRGICPLLKTNLLTGKCSLNGSVPAQAIQLLTPDLDQSKYTVTFGDYIFSGGPTDLIKWNANAGVNYGGPAGYINSPSTSAGPLLNVQRIDGNPFSVLSLSVYIPTAGSDINFLSIDASGNEHTLVDPYTNATSNFVNFKTSPGDPIFHDVVTFDMDGGSAFYLRDFSFQSTSVKILSVPIPVIPHINPPVPELDRLPMLVAGLFMLGALTRRRQGAKIR
jgi:hypothetical protein